jgi:hypothetical protein
MTKTGLGRISLAGNKFPKQESVLELATFLQAAAPSVQELDLSSTNIVVAQNNLRPLFAAVPHLSSLSLSDNDLGEDGIAILVDVLAGVDPQPLMKLKTLSLDRTIMINPLAANKKLKGTGMKALAHLFSSQAYLFCPLGKLLSKTLLPFLTFLSQIPSNLLVDTTIA